MLSVVPFVLPTTLARSASPRTRWLRRGALLLMAGVLAGCGGGESTTTDRAATRVSALHDKGSAAPQLDALNVVALPSGVSLHAMALEPFAQRVGTLRGSPLAQRQAHGERLINSPVPFSA